MEGAKEHAEKLDNMTDNKPIKRNPPAFIMAGERENQVRNYIPFNSKIQKREISKEVVINPTTIKPVEKKNIEEDMAKLFP